MNNVAALTLIDSEGKALLLQVQPLANWPDGSVKWLLCDFLADLPESGETVFRLQHAERPTQTDGPFRLERKAECWRIDTGACIFDIDTRILRPFLSVQSAESGAAAGTAEVHLIDNEGGHWTPQIDELTLEAGGPVRATLLFSGGFRQQKKNLLRFEARLHLFAASSRAALELRLHNPRAARHAGNLWDLGDPASVLLREWSFVLRLKAKEQVRLRLRTGEDNAWHELGSQSGGQVYQESSGGERWDSPVHRNRDGHVPLTFRGWRLSSGGQAVAEGLRAQPLLWWGETGRPGVSGSIDRFWQRFPKAAAVDPGGVTLSLLPPEFPGGHELQGGEQITETLRFDFAAPVECRGWGDPAIDVRCAADVYRASGVFPDGLWQPVEPRYAGLAQIALDENAGFLAKREKVDEYGWRNFGDLYADHESAYYEGDRPFVSHYNNQYDVLDSLYRLYLAGCDARWGELARDLAAHFADIDVNHTDEDREEYCQGIFWHTDHYLDAGLSTHRMASREHLAQKNPAFCGGGPAAEHCYSSGLTLHYFLTGDPRSRALVLTIAHWCWRSLRGPQTVGAALLRAVKNFSLWRQDRGTRAIWSRYPFSRGTGNCLNATLNAFEVTHDRRFLSRAAKIIQGTVHPEDHPEERDLLNAEYSWSYNVFLAAIGRFLHIKREWDELDGHYRHARDSLLTYARWMGANEYPYLEKPEILEYPNETWAGQDLRKGVIFLSAACHVRGTERLQFQERARFFLGAGFDELLRRETRHYTRPLALVLQNGWAVEALTAGHLLQAEPEPIVKPVGRPTPRLTLGEMVRRSLGDLLAVLLQTGPRREWRWLRTRLG